MVDREARDKMAELLRHFIAGQITNDDLCNELPRSSFDATCGLIEDMVEHHYEGLCCKPFRVGDDRPLTWTQRRDLARLVVYLKTDCEMSVARRFSERLWPMLFVAVVVLTLILRTPLLLVCLLLLYVGPMLWRKLRPPASSQQEDGVWPFSSREEYEEALKHPKLLRGKPA